MVSSDLFTTYLISAGFGVAALSVTIAALNLYYKDEKVPEWVKAWLRGLLLLVYLLCVSAIVVRFLDFLSG